jgi:hypothetical protein
MELRMLGMCRREVWLAPCDKAIIIDYRRW